MTACCGAFTFLAEMSAATIRRNPHSLSMPQPNKPPAVEKAEKQVAAVLDDLEQSTNSEVQKLQLEDVVASDAVTGKPLVQKAVEITVTPKPDRKWSR